MDRAFASRPAVSVLAAYYIAYMVGAGFGQWLMVIPGIPITVWPPNGVTLAAMLTNERRFWPWLLAIAAIGELTGNAFWFHNPILPALGYVIANALEVLVAALALTRFFTLPIHRIATLTQVLAFLGVAVIAAPLIGATIGSAIDNMVGKNPFHVTWPYWWLGDATGILISAPLVISMINAIREKKMPTQAQIVEATVIGLMLVILGAWVFFGDRPFAFILFLPILWAAIRFEMRGTTLAVVALVLVIGLHAQDLAQSTVSAAGIHESGRAQLFILTVASTGLIVAAIFRQYRQAAADLATANRVLEQRVIDRTAETEAAQRQFRVTFENAAVGMSIVDSTGTLVSVNDCLVEMLGYERHELEGSPLDKFTHPDDLPANNSAWRELRSGTTNSYVLEKRYLCKDGAVVWGLTSVSCVRRANGEIEYLIKVIQNITDRKKSDEVRQILMRELSHRNKNLLAVIHAVARQTAAHTPQEFLAKFEQRLGAISASQDLLTDTRWGPVLLEDVVLAQLAHLSDDLNDRFSISGSSVLLSTSAAQSLGMVVHELATNATKYGSLSNPAGQVQIAWRTTGDQFEMSWRECKGPMVIPPKKTGFGTKVIDKMLRSKLNGDVSIEYAPDGLVWRMRAPISALRN